jgi:DNA primase large subunit
MALPWARLDSNIHAHDKILSLLDASARQKWQAFALYVFALGWSVGQETDGRIPKSALKMLHGSTECARLLVEHRLWTNVEAGWEIVNFAERQQLSDETYTIRKAQHLGGLKGNCVRHHGPNCGCWRNAS